MCSIFRGADQRRPKSSTQENKSQDKDKALSDKDWECPNLHCGVMNPPARAKCMVCRSARPDGTEIARAAGARATLFTVVDKVINPNSAFKPGDWACTGCGNVNWDWRERCNMCNSARPDLQEKREGGKGGGYFDRQGAEERIEHNSDEEEYDEFGRKKKTSKAVSSSSARASSQPDNMADAADSVKAGKVTSKAARALVDGSNCAGVH